MAKNSSKYWKDRFVAVEAMNHTRATKAVNQVVPAFDSAQRQIEKELAVWYQRFADNNEISLADAKKLLKGKDLQELKWDIDEYIKYGRQNAIDQRWLKELENASAKYHISRLEALQIRTQQAAEVAFGNEVDVLDKLIASTYTADYYHTAYEIQKGMGIGFDIGRVDNEKIQRIMSKPWTADGLTFSDRIWRSKAQLLDSLDKELTQMCILGKAPDDAIANISKRLQVSKSQAGRLIMTESAYFASEAQRQCFNDLDVEQYEIVATLDSHTSDICQSMDGQVFKMSEFQAGVTAPPFHVWCRSTTVPFFDDEWGREGTRAARGEDGKTYQVPADMKYPEWKKAFVDGGIQTEEVKLEKVGKGDIIKSLTNKKIATNGLRNEEPLSEEEVNYCMEYAKKLGYKGDIEYSNMSNTSFIGINDVDGEKHALLLIGTDVKPLIGSLKQYSANQLISMKGTLAHEIIGHYEAWMGSFECNIRSIDEAQASIRAARFAPDLDKSDRYMLIRDALTRLRNDNIKLSEARKFMKIERR